MAEAKRLKLVWEVPYYPAYYFIPRHDGLLTANGHTRDPESRFRSTLQRQSWRPRGRRRRLALPGVTGRRVAPLDPVQLERHGRSELISEAK